MKSGAPRSSTTRLLLMLVVIGGGGSAVAFAALPVAASAEVAGSDDFVTTWAVSAGGTITIPVGGANGTYSVDWGDGTTSAGVTGDQTHTYASAGDYEVRISGDFTRIHLNDGSANA